MWLAKIPVSKEVSCILTHISFLSHYSMIFCDNGLLFVVERASYFLRADDLIHYSISQPAAFSVLLPSGSQSFKLGSTGMTIEIIPNDKQYKMITSQIPLLEKVESFSTYIDPMVSGGTYVKAYPSDAIYALPTRLKNLTHRCEMPLKISPKMFATYEMTHIKFAFSASNRRLKFQVNNVASGEYECDKDMQLNVEQQVPIGIIKDTFKLLSSNLCVIGYLPSVCDSGCIWYVRSISFGIFSTIIN